MNQEATSIPKIYYRYFTRDSVYYFDTQTNTTTYDFPSDGVVLDPYSFLPIHVDYFSNPNYQKLLDQYYNATNKPNQVDSTCENTYVKYTERTINWDDNLNDTHSEVNKVNDSNNDINSNDFSYSDDEADENISLENRNVFDDIYMPDDFKTIAKKYENYNYIKDYLTEYNNGNMFNKRFHTSIYQITKFSSIPIKYPLLRLSNQNLNDKAVKCFQLILNYTGVSGNDSDDDAKTIIDIIENNLEIVDEVYFQLIKQTNHNVNSVWELKTWELFLIVASIFPSSKYNSDRIKAHIAHHICNGNSVITDICCFTYIMFYTRCECNEIDKELLSTNPKNIINRMNQEYCNFNSSIYNHLWCQRKKYPKFPIPLIVFKMTNAIFDNDVKNTIGIFRLPGNLAVVQNIIQNINKGKANPFESAIIHDLISLFKQWFRDTLIPICPYSSLPYFKKASLSLRMEEYIQYINNYLPEAHIKLLGYLIGFLKEICKYQEKTKMNSSNLAVVFAPNIIRVPDDADEEEIQIYSKYSIQFVNFLINDWNTSEYYPLDLKP